MTAGRKPRQPFSVPIKGHSKVSGTIFCSIRTLLASVLTGEYVQQKKTLEHVVRKPGERKALSVSIGSGFAGLAELRVALASQDAASLAYA